MESIVMWIVAVMISAGVPSTVFALVIGRYLRRIDARESSREEEYRLAYQADQAALGGVRECAKAIVKGSHNGDLDRAAAYDEKIKHEQSDFIAGKAAKRRG